MAEGQDSAGAEAQELAKMANDLLFAFTRGTPEIEAGLRRWWVNHEKLPEAERPIRIPLSRAESEFLEKAKAIYAERRQASGGAQ